MWRYNTRKYSLGDSILLAKTKEYTLLYIPNKFQGVWMTKKFWRSVFYRSLKRYFSPVLLYWSSMQSKGTLNFIPSGLTISICYEKARDWPNKNRNFTVQNWKKSCLFSKLLDLTALYLAKLLLYIAQFWRFWGKNVTFLLFNQPKTE